MQIRRARVDAYKAWFLYMSHYDVADGRRLVVSNHKILHDQYFCL